MERVTMERAMFRQQIVAIRDWDAYQASLIGKEGRLARTQHGQTAKAAQDAKRQRGR
jgi:hypothetical protein